MPHGIVALRLQSARGNRAIAQTLQPRLARTIAYDNAAGTYIGTSRRPAWTRRIRDKMVEAYNTATGQTLTQVPWQKKGLSFDHVLAFGDIQLELQEFLNGARTQAAYKKWVTDFTSKGEPVETAEIHAALDVLMKALTKKVDPHKGVTAGARDLLRLLNSYSENIRLGNALINSWLQDHPDLDFEQSPKGTKRLPQQTKQNIATGKFTHIPRTPTEGEDIPISALRGAKRYDKVSPVKMGDMSPTTAQAVKALPSKKLNTNNPNVLAAIYGPSMTKKKASKTKAASTSKT